MMIRKENPLAYTLRLTRDDFEKIASRSILGRIWNECNELPKEITIEFPSRNLDWNEKHGGPDYLLIPEYVILAICDDIVYLKNNNVNVTIKSYFD